jgi:hypothetical protein
MLTDVDYNDIEQQLFALVNDMGLNFTKYLSLIIDTTEFTTANYDYLVCYREAISVLDNIADWRTQTQSVPATYVTAATVTSTSVAPQISVAT